VGSVVSYARWFEGDVYVFTSKQGIECCFCSFVPRHWVEDPERPLNGYVEQDDPDDTETYHSNAEMIAHLERHRAAGDVVPEDAFERLRDPADAAENEAIWAEERGGA
jgi:hypothetical protein